MKMKIPLVILSILFSKILFASDPKFPVSAIPEELKKDVNIVVREDKMVYKILSKNRGNEYAYYVVTILNGNGQKSARRSFFYDRLSKLKELKCSVYNAEGMLIKKLKTSEISDRSAFDGYTLYSDDRIKSVDLSQNVYPYTVEFEYEMEYDFLYDFGGSWILSGEKESVQHASYQLIYPSDLAPRYKTVNINNSPRHEKMPDGLESLLWTFENIKPIKLEPLGPDMEELIPQVMAAPGKFEYEGYGGDMSNWKDFGKWILLLNQGRDELLPSTKQKIRELTIMLTSTEEKIKVLYEYLQSKTRYVSIQLGIGGHQPFEAMIVDKNGYGDCKALSNYMVAMLKEIGIKGNYTLIAAGRENDQSLITDFPSSQFNHAIVAVPDKTDTIWLECTSQTNPFGYQGLFTGNRKAFMITDEGGVIVNTIRYKTEQNIQARTADVYIETTGNAKSTVRTTYSGLQYENDYLNFMLDKQYDDQKKWLRENTDIPSFDINSFTMTDSKGRNPKAVVKIDLTLNRLASVSGKRLFLTPNLMNRSTDVPEKVDNRKTKVVLKMGYVDFDTIQYHLPEELYPEFLPAPIKLSSRFGEYEATFKIDQGSLVYIRKIKMNNGEFPPESYSELIDFYKSVNKADNAKIVFLNKT